MGGYEIQVDNANCVNQLRAEGGGGFVHDCTYFILDKDLNPWMSDKQTHSSTVVQGEGEQQWKSPSQCFCLDID